MFYRLSDKRIAKLLGDSYTVLVQIAQGIYECANYANTNDSIVNSISDRKKK